MLKNKAPHWSKLDNVAKIFPPTTSQSDPKVFRFACELKEMVISNLLQKAAEETLKLFPYFSSTLKRGIFWYYLEQSNLVPIVKEEDLPICSRLYDRNKKTLLFRITYYKKRINMEVYHALSDGMGALQFFKVLVGKYLSFAHKELENVLVDYDTTLMEMVADSFDRYYEKPQITKKKLVRAWKMKGATFSFERLKVIEGVLSVSELKKIVKRYHTTITTFLLTVYLQSMIAVSSPKDRKRPFTIHIPVNLRTHFASTSTKNFFGIITVAYSYRKEDTFEDILSLVDKTLKEELTTDRLSIRMNQMSSLEKNLLIRSAPLFLKDLGLKFGTYLTDLETSTSFSNLGIITMPKEMIPYIRLFDAFNSTNKMIICCCSFEDQFVISFTSRFVNSNIQKHFFRVLTEYSLKIEIRSNEVSNL